MKVGRIIRCEVCGKRKKPIGRSAPLVENLCLRDCPGYDEKPFPGELWPGEESSEIIRGNLYDVEVKHAD